MAGRPSRPAVETTSSFRSDSDREHHAYEQHLVDALLAVEQRHGIVTITHLTGHPPHRPPRPSRDQHVAAGAIAPASPTAPRIRLTCGNAGRRLLQEAPCDDHPLDLVGALVDLGDL